MTNKYIGSECPICHQPLRENDDIVVCPECGAPYHRACYQQEGRCVFPELHEHGESYEIKQPETQDEKPTGYATRCYRCGAIVDEGTLFCHHCGASLQNVDQQQIPFPNSVGQNSGQGNPFFGANMETIRMEDDLGDGYTTREYTMAIRDNVPYYLLRFVRFARGNAAFDFNFSAMLFGPIYFFYRRMVKWGLLYTLGLFITWLPSLYYSFRALLTGQFESSDGLYMLIEGCSLLGYALRFVAGMFANRLYYRHCKNRLDGYRQLVADGVMPEDSRMAVWSRRGGVKMSNVWLFIGSVMLLFSIGVWISAPLAGVNYEVLYENYINYLTFLNQ